jgi:ABC-type transport system involved in multi-copper enzyme maturation permease subunit
MRSSVYSLVLTFFTFFLILPIIDAVGSVAKFKPWFSITFANGISQYIFDNPYPTDKIFTTAAPGASGVGVQTYSLAQYYPEVRLSLIVMAVYFIVAFVLSIFLAQRREM